MKTTETERVNGSMRETVKKIIPYAALALVAAWHASVYAQGEDLVILGDEIASEWTTAASRGIELVEFSGDGPVFAGEAAAVLQVERAGWHLQIRSLDSPESLGFTTLRFAFHPGDLVIPRGPRLEVAIGRTIDLLEKGLIDANVREWQVVEIDLSDLLLSTTISEIDFLGNLYRGTFYLDDLRLVHASDDVPIVTSISPQRGVELGATPVQIRGSNFYRGATVVFGDREATNVRWVSPFIITAVTPEAVPGIVDVRVINPGEVSGVLADGFTFFSGLFTVPAGERQLFLDDVPIAEMDGLTRSMHQAVKKGAVLRPDYLGQERHFTVRNVPNWDREREVFRFLVTEAAGPNVSTVWESDDGLHWVRVGTSDMVTYTVVYDPTDPDPSRRYKAMNRTRIAVSPDMLTWEVVGNPRIPGSDEHNLSFDEKSGVFFFSVKRGGPFGRYGRSHALYTSEDLVRWTKVGISGEDSLFHADDEDQEHNREAIKALMEELVADPRLAETDFYVEGNYNVDIYNTPVFRYESHYLALPAIHPSITMDLFDPSDNIAFKIPQLWWSRDLENWSRPEDREEFITLSRPESGAYDMVVAFPPSSPVIRGDELWFYYGGGDGLGWPPKTGLDLRNTDWKYYRLDRNAICLAVLRRDGFMSLDAGAGGSVLTREFTVSGPELFVNVDATDGELVVEVIDESAVVARSAPLLGDQPNAAVAWQDGNIADHEGTAVQLRFALRDASLYSFWFEVPEE